MICIVFILCSIVLYWKHIGRLPPLDSSRTYCVRDFLTETKHIGLSRLLSETTICVLWWQYTLPWLWLRHVIYRHQLGNHFGDTTFLCDNVLLKHPWSEKSASWSGFRISLFGPDQNHETSLVFIQFTQFQGLKGTLKKAQHFT